MAESDPPKPHPLHGVSEEKCHELLMSERNLLVSAKADRENELVRTIIQLASAALLLIPSLISSKAASVPRVWDAKLFYVGLVLIAVSLLLAVVEQHLSSLAYGRQIEVVFAYFTKNSGKDCDEGSAKAVRWSRTGAMISFSCGVIITAIGMAILL